MNKDQNQGKHSGYNYFLDQCNKTPLSEDWRNVFGEINEETLKQFDYEVKDPYNRHEVVKFAKLLERSLREPTKYCDAAYKNFCSRGQVPNAIRATIDEILSDRKFQLLLRKERNNLGIPVKTGLFLLPPEVYGERKSTLTPEEDKAVNRLSLYVALTGKTWRRFFKYLLLYNYVIPITYLDINELPEFVENKKLAKLLDTLFEKIKMVPLKKRQTNLADEMLKLNEDEATQIVYQSNALREIKGKEGIISRKSKLALRKFLKESCPELAERREAIKKRRERAKDKPKKQLREIQEKASSLLKTSKLPEK